jgi:hypothetical protein
VKNREAEVTAQENNMTLRDFALADYALDEDEALARYINEMRRVSHGK